jgi:hypothetical protein
MSCGSSVITPILHCKAKTATQLIFETIGKSGFGFCMCKIKGLTFNLRFLLHG